MARSSARISFGAKRCTRGSGRLVSPSENNCAEVEQIAQIVVDLRHREPERREMALLLQHRGEIALHAGELALGQAHLVLAAATRR